MLNRSHITHIRQNYKEQLSALLPRTAIYKMIMDMILLLTIFFQFHSTVSSKVRCKMADPRPLHMKQH